MLSPRRMAGAGMTEEPDHATVRGDKMGSDMTILVLAEHNNKALHAATRHAVTAAAAIGGDIHILVAGSGCDAAAKQAAALKGVTKVLVSDAPYYAYPLAENI